MAPAKIRVWPAGVYRVDTEVDWLGPCPGGLYGTHPRQTQMHVGQTLDLALIGAWASGTRSSNESAVHWVSGSLDGHTSSYRAVGAGAATISAAGIYCLDDDSNLSVPDCPLLVITVAE